MRHWFLLAGFIAFFAAVIPVDARGSKPPHGTNGLSAQGRPVVIGMSYRVRSRIVSGGRRVNVYLPEHYADTSRRFPVLYLLDGGETEDFHHISGLARTTAAYGGGEEMIVVGIAGADRQHDLTTPSSVALDRAAAPTAGGAARYRRFLVDELRPWVASRYRTNGRSALIGESLAGLFVLDTFLREPGAFDDYISISPSLWWDGESLSEDAAHLLAAGDFRGKRLWMAMAGADDDYPEMHRAAGRLQEALRAMGGSAPSWSYRVLPGETHATVYHPAALLAFRQLYPAVAAPK